MRRAYSSRPGEPRCKVDVGEVKELGEVGGGVEEGEVEGGGGVEEGEGKGGGGVEEGDGAVGEAHSGRADSVEVSKQNIMDDDSTPAVPENQEDMSAKM